MQLRLIWIIFLEEFLQLTSAQLNGLNSSGIDFFYGTTHNDFTHYHISEVSNILYHPNYDHNKKIVFYIYGYREYRDIQTVRTIVSAYQRRGDHNILVLDWERLVAGDYVFEAFPNTFKFGDILADVIIKMTSNGLKLFNLHVVSHSLGSQLAGALGRNIIKKTRNRMRLKRITALDPAFPLFYPSIFGAHLSANDADLVDVIHTDGWIYGAPVSTGTVDFWPNGGKQLRQPGCEQRNWRLLDDGDLCAHWRSVVFYAESVQSTYKPTFQSQKCSSWSNFKNGYCDNKDKAISMGIDCPQDARGDYYLQTNKFSPYSRGYDGTKYNYDSKKFPYNKFF